MPALAKNAVFTPIPVQLSDTEFNEFILPHLSMPKRGPKCKLGYYRGTTPILTSWRKWRDRYLLSSSKWALVGWTTREIHMVVTRPSGSRPANMDTGVYSFATISVCVRCDIYRSRSHHGCRFPTAHFRPAANAGPTSTINGNDR